MSVIRYLVRIALWNHVILTFTVFAFTICQKPPLTIEEAGKHNVHWKFISENSPHFGGIWEVGVRRQGIFKLIKTVLNSRPLSALNDDQVILYFDFKPLSNSRNWDKNLDNCLLFALELFSFIQQVPFFKKVGPKKGEQQQHQDSKDNKLRAAKSPRSMTTLPSKGGLTSLQPENPEGNPDGPDPMRSCSRKQGNGALSEREISEPEENGEVKERHWVRVKYHYGPSTIKDCVGLSKATIYIITTLGSVNLEYFFWRVIDNVKGNYCDTAPNGSERHERQCVGTL
ncbi:hypothetical protein FQA39_LY06660 [Lamprigera yunnana]|nr:hypothetical protein FQA39_LY06660 [Lamprigera yunnana]